MAVNVFFDIDGGASDGPPQYAYTVRYDYDGSGNLIYSGWALSSPTPGCVPFPANNPVPLAGPTSSGPYWAIKKITYDGSNRTTIVQWAGGNTQMSNIWDNRVALSYQ